MFGGVLGVGGGLGFEGCFLICGGGGWFVGVFFVFMVGGHGGLGW